MSAKKRYLRAYGESGIITGIEQNTLARKRPCRHCHVMTTVHWWQCCWNCGRWRP